MGETAARYRTLLEISGSLATHLQFSDLLQHLSRSLRGIIPFDGMGLSLCDRERQSTACFGVKLKMEQGLIEVTARHPSRLLAGLNYSKPGDL